MSTGAQCAFCRHFREDTDEPTCDAFPSGIPTEIFTGQFDHRRPFEGDQGIRFEPEEGAPSSFSLEGAPQ